MVTIFVCVSCRPSVETSDGELAKPGVALADTLIRHLKASGRDGGLIVKPVDCLAVCERPCTIAFSGADKWTYLIGDLDPVLHLDEVVDAASSFAASENGIIPWAARPASFRKGVIARVPPLGFAASSVPDLEDDR